MQNTQRFYNSTGTGRGTRTKKNLPKRKTLYKRRHLDKTRQRRNKKDSSIFKQTLKSAKEIWQKVDDPLQQKKMFGGNGEKMNVSGTIKIEDVFGDLSKFMQFVNGITDYNDLTKKDGTTITGQESKIDIIEQYIEKIKNNTILNGDNSNIITIKVELSQIKNIYLEKITKSDESFKIYKPIIINKLRKIINLLVENGFYAYEFNFQGTLDTHPNTVTGEEGDVVNDGDKVGEVGEVGESKMDGKEGEEGNGNNNGEGSK